MALKEALVRLVGKTWRQKEIEELDKLVSDTSRRLCRNSSLEFS